MKKISRSKLFSVLSIISPALSSESCPQSRRDGLFPSLKRRLTARKFVNARRVRCRRRPTIATHSGTSGHPIFVRFDTTKTNRRVPPTIQIFSFFRIFAFAGGIGCPRVSPPYHWLSTYPYISSTIHVFSNNVRSSPFWSRFPPTIVLHIFFSRIEPKLFMFLSFWYFRIRFFDTLY